jgi:hypothetical protein
MRAVGLNADQSLVTRRRSPIMTTVTMHVLPDNRKTTITIPSEAWAHMTRQSEATKTGGITRTVTQAYDGTHVVVDVHDGGTVVVWVEGDAELNVAREAPTPHCPDRMTDAPDPIGDCPSCGEHDTSTPCRYR